jgi:acetoin utilization protein AcuB
MSNQQGITVGEFMTPNPCTVDALLSIADAQDRMFANNIRHLLVVSDEHLVGITSTRDLALASSLPNIDPRGLKVTAAMNTRVYACDEDAPLDEVAWYMERNRYGCAVILRDEIVVGIFTTTDALRALRQVLTGEPAEPAMLPTHEVPPSDEPRRGLSYRLSAELLRSHGGPTAHQGMIR